jgi:hypothetical protein
MGSRRGRRRRSRASATARPTDRGQFTCAGPLSRVARQRRADHLCEIPWQAGQVRFRGLDPQDPLRGALAGKRVYAAGQVRQHATPREDVHRRRRRRGAQLFRGGSAAAALHHPVIPAPLSHVPGDTEVDDA